MESFRLTPEDVALTRAFFKNNSHASYGWEVDDKETRTVTVNLAPALLGLALLLGAAWLARWYTRRRRR